MKTLKEYINISRINIKDSLDLHFYAEFILNESFKKTYFNIHEKYGSYIGQKELIIDLAKEIWFTISNHEPENEFILDRKDLNHYSNIFFNKLIIQLGNIGSSYVISSSKFDNKTKLFDMVRIDIDYNEIQSYNDVCSILMHELLHAFNEYMGYMTNSKYKLNDLVGNGTPYNKTRMLNNKVSIENICKRILNNIRKWEQNAYISELSAELEKNEFNISKFGTTQEAYKEAKKIFMDSDTWFQYSGLWRRLNTISNNNDEMKEFESVYNEINGTNLSFNKIYRKLDSQFNKILSKMERLVPKLFYDYYNEKYKSSLSENVCGRQSMAMIEFINIYDDYLLQESVKPINGGKWEVYVGNKLDNEFTKCAQNWKKYPKIGNGWYSGGAIFKIIDIKDNIIYTKKE